jgi:hypothetical protein
VAVRYGLGHAHGVPLRMAMHRLLSMHACMVK